VGPAPSQLTRGGRFLRDEHDRVRIFRGVNLSGRSKHPPFLPFDDPALLDPLPAWGFNVVRLLLTWEGIEPRRREYDDGYLERVETLAREAGARGLSVLVDIHQDIFSRAFGGDGVPPWVVDGEQPAPDRRWFLRYFTSARVRRAQREFWTGMHGHRDDYLSAFRYTVERLRHVPAIIGYDPWNEPMGGLRHVLSGHFERKILADFYTDCAAIRDELDPTRLIFVEPSPLAALGAPTAIRVPSVPGLVYAPHIYDASALTIGRYMPWASTFPTTLRRHLDVSERDEAPLFVGEFGVLNWVRDGERMLEHECRLFDRHFVSWTAWHYNPTDLDWNDENASIVEPDASLRPYARPLVRPNARAIAGTPTRWESRVGSPWTLRYVASGTADTEIVVPAGWNGGRPEVVVAGGESEWGGDVLRVRAAAKADVTVTLAPH
jgi:endoglycosylceramidase